MRILAFILALVAGGMACMSGAAARVKSPLEGIAIPLPYERPAAARPRIASTTGVSASAHIPLPRKRPPVAANPVVASVRPAEVAVVRPSETVAPVVQERREIQQRAEKPALLKETPVVAAPVIAAPVAASVVEPKTEVAAAPVVTFEAGAQTHNEPFPVMVPPLGPESLPQDAEIKPQAKSQAQLQIEPKANPEAQSQPETQVATQTVPDSAPEPAAETATEVAAEPTPAQIPAQIPAQVHDQVAMLPKGAIAKPPAAATAAADTVAALTPEAAALAARADAMQIPQVQILPAIFRKVPSPRHRPLSAWPRPDDIVMRDVTASSPEAECDAALNSGILVAEREQLGHRGACYVPYAVKVRGIMVGRKKIEIVPPAMLRCGFALAVANWVRAEVAPAAEQVGAKFVGLRQLDSYNCRTMSSSKRVMSEHSAGNALDIAEILYADHDPAYLTSSATRKSMRLRLRSTACNRFKTVLGPGVPQHHDHIHIDLRKHFGPGGICHWNVL